jgi:hypothetical protein
MQPISYDCHRFPPEVIRHAIWLYARFTLSYRDVEELLAERGLDLSYETIRRWVLKFGPAFARNLRRLQPRPADTWHLDEMVVSIRGRRMYLWRAVDSEGEILDLLVQPKRDKAAALRLMRKLLRKQGYAPVPIDFGPTGLRAAISGSVLAMSRAFARTTGRRTPTRWCDDESGRCSASNRRHRLSAFSPSAPESSHLRQHRGRARHPLDRQARPNLMVATAPPRRRSTGRICHRPQQVDQVPSPLGKKRGEAVGRL